MSSYSEPGTKLNYLNSTVRENWPDLTGRLYDKSQSVETALHEMSQNVTVLLTTLELTQMTGQLLSEDLEVLLANAFQLRDYIRVLRASGEASLSETYSSAV